MYVRRSRAASALLWALLRSEPPPLSAEGQLALPGPWHALLAAALQAVAPAGPVGLKSCVQSPAWTAPPRHAHQRPGGFWVPARCTGLHDAYLKNCPAHLCQAVRTSGPCWRGWTPSSSRPWPCSFPRLHLEGWPPAQVPRDHQPHLCVPTQCSKNTDQSSLLCLTSSPPPPRPILDLLEVMGFSLLGW